MLLGAFPVDFFGEIVQWIFLEKLYCLSLFLKLDNCLLISNPLVDQFLCNTVSKLPVQTVLNASTGAARHLKSSGFMTSSGPLRSALTRELSPIIILVIRVVRQPDKPPLRHYYKFYTKITEST